MSGGKLTYSSEDMGPGVETNDALVTFDGATGVYRVQDKQPLTIDAGSVAICMPAVPQDPYISAVSCDTNQPGGSVSSLEMNMGGNGDIAVLDPAVTAPAVLNGDSGNDTLTGGSGADCINGGSGATLISCSLGTASGTDTVSYANRVEPVFVSLDGIANDGAVGEGDTLRNVGNIIGGAGDDTLAGDGGANSLQGGAGSDTVGGGGGDDEITGGANGDELTGGSGDDTFREGSADSGPDAIIGGDGGADRVDYGSRTTAVDVSLDGAANDGAASPGEQDNIDVENMTGGSGADALSGDVKANAINGGAGDDTIDGGAGADDLNGADGLDTVTYASRAQPVTVDLTQSGAVHGGDEDGSPTTRDTLANFRHVTGGSGNDTLVGDADANTLRGHGGEDSLDGGFGSDTLNGGDDDDTADYSARTAPVTVVLAAVGATNGNDDDGPAGARDTLADIQDVKGGSGDDALTGDSDPNKLTGNGGNDSLDGGGGDDTFDEGGDPSGADGDAITGGDGTDAVDYSGRAAALDVSLDGNQNDGAAGEQDNVDVENITGGSGADTLSGDVKANAINGGPGDDAIDSRDGVVDEVDCGDGMADAARTDSNDVVQNCEAVDRPDPGDDSTEEEPDTSPATPDTTPPVSRPRVRRRVPLAILLKNGLRTTVSCSEACRISQELLLRRSARGHRLRRTVLIGRGKARLASARRVLVVVKLTRKGKRALRRAVRAGRARRVTVTLRTTATDAAGNTTRTRKKVVVKGPTRGGRKRR